MILAALLTGVGAGFGTIDRLGSESAGLAEADIVLLGITYFLLAFVIIYFNAALDRGRHGSPGRRHADAGRRVPPGQPHACRRSPAGR